MRPSQMLKGRDAPDAECYDCDVFLSFSGSDERHARKIFDFLEAHDVRVFFSRESIQRMGESDYMEAIHEALDRAHHFVVVTSTPENTRNRWVQAEWTLFLNELRSGRKRGNLVVVTAGSVKIEELPIALRARQVVPLSDQGMEELLRFVDRAPPPPRISRTEAAGAQSAALASATVRAVGPAAAAATKNAPFESDVTATANDLLASVPSVSTDIPRAHSPALSMRNRLRHRVERVPPGGWVVVVVLAIGTFLFAMKPKVDKQTSLSPEAATLAGGWQVGGGVSQVGNLEPPLTDSAPVKPGEQSERHPADGSRAGDSEPPVYFEFQVETQVQPIDSTQQQVAFPDALRGIHEPGEVIGQFVVDTLGRIETQTFKLLRPTHSLFASAVRAQLPRMRFRPAVVGQRKVRQLVQQVFVFEIDN